jgi:glycosyltransferase involved in cell wall biosynthesis
LRESKPDYNYSPNVVAAEYLIREVWPRLAQLRPGARLLIAGPNSRAVPSFESPPAGVEFLDFVADLNALYRRTRVLCCPVRSGSGTRVKILEAASYGIPIVSTPLGAEGIELVADTDMLLRNDAQSLAEACSELLADDARARRMGVSARERVLTLYSRDASVSRVRAALIGGETSESHDSHPVA